MKKTFILAAIVALSTIATSCMGCGSKKDEPAVSEYANTEETTEETNETTSEETIVSELEADAQAEAEAEAEPAQEAAAEE